MATVTTLNTYIDAAVAAIASEDWASAETQLLAAEACLAGIPATDFDGESTEYQDRINKLLDRVRAKRANTLTTGGIQTTKIQYARTSAAT